MFRLLLTLLIVLTSLSSPVLAQGGDYYALLVGVQDYDGKTLSKLRFARSDMLQFADLLKKNGVRESNMVVMHDDVRNLKSFRYQAEAGKIRRQLDLLLAGLGPNDSVIVAFSGHGVQREGESENYFCPLGADIRELLKPAKERSSLVSLSEVYDRLGKCKAGRKLLLADACRDQPLTEDLIPKTSGNRKVIDLDQVAAFSRQASPAGKGIVALFSCAPGQQSFEDGGLKHGVFFHHVMQAWQKKTAGVDGELDLLELAMTARSTTSAYARQLNRAQTPQLRGDITGQWLLPLAAPTNSGDFLATFTVKQNDAGGPPAAGAEVQLLWLASPTATPQRIGKSLAGSDGRVTIRGTLSRDQKKSGDFGAVIAYAGETAKYSLPRFPGISSFNLFVEKSNLLPLSAPRKAGDLMTNSLGMKLAYIPAGEFLMGSPASEKDRKDNETQHRVKLTQPFYLGVYEVTQGEWKAIMRDQPWKANGYVKEGYVKEGSSYPATRVSWDDAVKFCAALTKRELAAGRISAGQSYRLPTEAEWEYACRAGTTTRFHFGDDPSGSTLKEYAWFYDNTFGVGEKYGHAVGLKKPNGWGIYDLHGNVWEWCSDMNGSYQASTVTDPKGSKTGSLRAYRGGCANVYAEHTRSASRNSFTPDSRYIHLGFRVAFSPAGPGR